MAKGEGFSSCPSRCPLRWTLFGVSPHGNQRSRLDIEPLRPSSRSSIAVRSSERHSVPCCIRPRTSGLATYVFMLFAPTALFFSAVAPHLMHGGVHSLVLLAALSYALATLFMALAACTDPGFVPVSLDRLESMPEPQPARIIGEVLQVYSTRSS